MFLSGRSWQNRNGQHAEGSFLALFAKEGTKEIRACVRYVRMHQLGHFMSGDLVVRSDRAEAWRDKHYGDKPYDHYRPYVTDGAYRVYVEGTYGDNGLLCDADDHPGLWEILHPLPEALAEMWRKDTQGWNSSGSEGPSIRQWALDNIKLLRRPYMKILHLIPAFGRDYKSKKEIEGSLVGDLDFIIADISSQYDGKPINLPQIKEAGYTHLNVRYAKQTKAAVIEVAKLTPTTAETPARKPGWYVKIVETTTNKIEKEMGPMDERRAERVQRGASINLNHDEFHIETEEVT